MKRFSRFIMCGFLVLSFVFLLHMHAYAEVPLNNLEGVGGIAFNPLAYLANPNKEGEGFLDGKVGKPSLGVWYVSLSDVNVDWTTFGVAETFFNRVEVSYGREIIAQDGANTIQKNSFGTKVLLMEENFKDLKFIPAISIGGIYKKVEDQPAGVDDDSFDFYLVGTKLITQLPRPLLVSGGVLSTKGRVTGVYGFDNKRDEAFFANIVLLPLDNLGVGFEYKQGASFPGYKNADYWNLHAAWFVNESLSLVAAYVNAGDEKSSSEVGLGDGCVLSVHYDF